MPILFSNPFSSVKIPWFTNKVVLKFNVVLVIMIEQGHSKTHNTCYISFVIFIFLDYLQIPNKGQTLLYKWNVNSLIGFVKMQTFFFTTCNVCASTENGASKDPCSDTYCGPRAFSESEVKGVAGFLNAVPGRFRAYIDFHSFSQLWMTPWGYTTTLPPEFTVQVGTPAYNLEMFCAFFENSVQS